MNTTLSDEDQYDLWSGRADRYAKAAAESARKISANVEWLRNNAKALEHPTNHPHVPLLFGEKLHHTLECLKACVERMSAFEEAKGNQEVLLDRIDTALAAQAALAAQEHEGQEIEG